MTDWTPQAIYDVERNFQIETFWDEGFSWYLGDALNGHSAQGWSETYRGALEQLRAAFEKEQAALLAGQPLTR